MVFATGNVGAVKLFAPVTMLDNDWVGTTKLGKLVLDGTVIGNNFVLGGCD